MHFVLGILMIAQLSLPPGAQLPQILTANFRSTTPVKAGQQTDIVVTFTAVKGFVIDRQPQTPLTLKLTEVPGVKLTKSEIVAPTEDPKSKDEYYVDLPIVHVTATAAKAGKYEVPGKMTYFFCSKSDGFCSRQTVDVKIPLQVQ
jgi:hypothetical protein